MKKIGRGFLLFLILLQIAIQKCSEIGEITDGKLGNLKAKQRDETRQPLNDQIIDEELKVDQRQLLSDDYEDDFYCHDDQFSFEVFRRIGSEESLFSLDEEGEKEEGDLELELGEEMTSSMTDVTTTEGGSSLTINSKFVTEIELVGGDGTVEGEISIEPGAFTLPGIIEESDNILNHPTVMYEISSVASDWETLGDDCFKGLPVNRVSMLWIQTVFVPYLKSGKRLSISTQLEILELVESNFRAEETILNVGIDDDETLFVVGDVHGQFEDMIRIFESHGYPSFCRKFIFNGDIVDRGPNSIECLLTLFLMKICCPFGIYITRGNHESHTCGPGTFREECFERTIDPEKFFLACHKVFMYLPLGYVIQDQFFVCHGGLPEDFNLNSMRCAKKPEYDLQQQTVAMSLLWNDPHEGTGMRPSLRGGSTLSFGCDVTMNFLSKNGFTLLIRSHEYHKNGYFYSHNNRCLTIFSASNYCGLDNDGTVMKIFPDLRYEIIPLETEIQIKEPYGPPKVRSLTLNFDDCEFVYPGIEGTYDDWRVPSIPEEVKGEKKLSEEDMKKEEENKNASFFPRLINSLSFSL